jgi:hypothetical protein
MIEVHDRSVAYGHGGLQVIGFFKYQPADQLGSKQLTLMPPTAASLHANRARSRVLGGRLLGYRSRRCCPDGLF